MTNPSAPIVLADLADEDLSDYSLAQLFALVPPSPEAATELAILNAEIKALMAELAD